MSTTAVKAAAIAFVIAGTALGAQQAPPAAASCTISGTITGLGGPLPGVSITVRRDATVQTAASTDIDGTFKLTLPDASYLLTAELTGFDSAQKDVTVSPDVSCAQTVDVAMALTPRCPPHDPSGLWALFTYVEAAEYDFANMGQVAEAGRRLAQFHNITRSIELEEVVLDINPQLRRWWTHGGRVLGVGARGASVAQARERAYAAVERIRFEGAQYRSDIAARALRGA